MLSLITARKSNAFKIDNIYHITYRIYAGCTINSNRKLMVITQQPVMILEIGLMGPDVKHAQFLYPI